MGQGSGGGGEASGFCEAMLTRTLFSCLVDADFLETERFYSDAARPAGPPYSRAARQRGAITLNAQRAEIRRHATAVPGRAPGVFTLTVPTGGGKTLAVLSFAREHAVRHGLRRAVYVTLYTAIIEQTAAVFRAALDS